MTSLLIMRHGEAGWAASDAERPLTERGRQQVIAMAERHRSTLQEAAAVLASPLVRAQQTADLVRQRLSGMPAATPNPLLGPDCHPADVIEWLYQQGERPLLLVSHQPLVSRLISLLAYGHEQGDTPMDTASLACLEVEVMAPGCAELRWIEHAAR